MQQSSKSNTYESSPFLPKLLQHAGKLHSHSQCFRDIIQDVNCAWKSHKVFCCGVPFVAILFAISGHRQDNTNSLTGSIYSKCIHSSNRVQGFAWNIKKQQRPQHSAHLTRLHQFVKAAWRTLALGNFIHRITTALLFPLGWSLREISRFAASFSFMPAKTFPRPTLTHANLPQLWWNRAAKRNDSNF